VRRADDDSATLVHMIHGTNLRSCRHTRRMLRPGGLMLIRLAPRGREYAAPIDLPGQHAVRGAAPIRSSRRMSDEESIAELCAGVRSAHFRHVNRPPYGRDADATGAARAMARRVSGGLDQYESPSGTLTRAAYVSHAEGALRSIRQAPDRARGRSGPLFKVVVPRPLAICNPADRKFHLPSWTVADRPGRGLRKT
jgi:hypothetical protein